MGHTFKLTVPGNKDRPKPCNINGLLDSGAFKSCMSRDAHLKLKLPPLRPLPPMRVNGANGTSLQPVGLTDVEFEMYGRTFTQEFIVCSLLRRPIILGTDFMEKNDIMTGFKNGKKVLMCQGTVLTEEVEDEKGTPFFSKRSIRIPARTAATTEITLHPPGKDTTTPKLSGFQYVNPSESLKEDYPNLYIPEMAIRHAEDMKNPRLMVSLYNLDYESDLFIPRDTVMAFANDVPGDVDFVELAEVEDLIEEMSGLQCRNWIPRRPSQESQGLQGRINEIQPLPDQLPMVPPDTAFICSPADVDSRRRVELSDAPVSDETRQRFKELCNRYPNVFSKSNTDIGRTKLVTMDIDTGDSKPICQKPYTLPLKHYEWVKKEIDTLERAGVISHSLSPWASPIVVVPKKSAPDAPPCRRLCVDYRSINRLQTQTKRVDVEQRPETVATPLTLHPLPKIDDIFARLGGARIFSTLDLRSGYYHIALTPESRKKSAFITPFGKWEFSSCPFGLAQAPAYFSLLISKVLQGLDFAIGYLDDIIIYSRDEEEHIRHIETVFQRLNEAGLKLKLSKCDFFKREIHYLGHLLSAEGIRPNPEKVTSISEMPAPQTPKEVKQFLGLVGYYRKFIPRFSDIARPLTRLTCQDVKKIEWSPQCETAFQTLKNCLCDKPILVYPDPSLPYTLYTDASRYAWSGVLTQTHTVEINGQMITADLPVTYVSGLFRGSQLNWAALTKEAFAIYMSVRKLDFYLAGSDVLVRSDHLPLKKFLQRNTLNAKVNNWAVELESYNLRFEWIQGKKNTLADTLSRLIKMDPDIELQPEQPGFEFGYAIFDSVDPVRSTQAPHPADTYTAETWCLDLLFGDADPLPLAEMAPVPNVPTVQGNNDVPSQESQGLQGRKPIQMTPVSLDPQEISEIFTQDLDLIMLDEVRVESPSNIEELKQLQAADPRCRNIIKHLQDCAARNKQTANGKIYRLQDGVLRATFKYQMELHDVIELPKSLVTPVLTIAHDNSGHNGFQRTYAALKRAYHWKGMKRDVAKHCQQCTRCKQFNIVPARYSRGLHYKVPTAPMEFIAMDLIGEFHPKSTQGNSYALTVIDMFTGYTWCIPIRNKQAKTVVKAYTNGVWAQFGASRKVVSDNGSEFKCNLFEEVAKRLGVELKIYTAPFSPASNGKIEGFHRFLKACIGKHLNLKDGKEWDDIVPYATAAYNFFPNEHSKESAHYLMFGRDPLVPYIQFLEAKPRYLGNDENLLDLQRMEVCHQIAAKQIALARKKHRQPNSQMVHDHKIKIGDSVLIKDHTAKAWDPKYQDNYRVVNIFGNNVIVKDAKGKRKTAHVKDVKKMDVADLILAKLPDESARIRPAKLVINPHNIPDLEWKLSDKVNTDFHKQQSRIPLPAHNPNAEMVAPAAVIEIAEALAKQPLTPRGSQQRRTAPNPFPPVLCCSVCATQNTNYMTTTGRYRYATTPA